MRSIYGEELGNTIDFRSVGAYTMTHPWPPETAVSAGKGVVLRSRSGVGPESLMASPADSKTD